MTGKQLQAFRETLETRLQQSTGRSEKVGGLHAEQEPDPIDEAQSQSLREVAVHMMSTDWQVQKAVQTALGRLDSGQYGRCEECDEPIVLRRLKALPWATRCVACQEETEAALTS